jgi:flagellar assembly protein FliH
MSNLYAAEQTGDALRVPVWTRAARPAARFTAWGAEPVWQEPEEEEEIEEEPAPVPIDLDAIQARGFADGYAAGIDAGRREADAARAEIKALAESLAVLRPEPTQALGALIAATVERLLGEIVGTTPVDRDTLLLRAQTAAALIGDETRPAVLKLNPEDIMLLDGAALPVAIEADAALARGALRLETVSGWIEDSPALRLDRLRAGLDRIAAAR